MKQYTDEQTAKFIADRNERRAIERFAKKHRGVIVWDSTNKGTFRGSIRQKFTGEKRCGIHLN